MVEPVEVDFEVIDPLPGALDGTSEQQNDLDNFLILGDHFIKTSLVL